MNVEGLAARKITSGGGRGWGVIRGVGILVQQRTGWVGEYGTGRGGGSLGYIRGLKTSASPTPNIGACNL